MSRESCSRVDVENEKLLGCYVIVDVVFYGWT